MLHTGRAEFKPQLPMTFRGIAYVILHSSKSHNLATIIGACNKETWSFICNEKFKLETKGQQNSNSPR